MLAFTYLSRYLENLLRDYYRKIPEIKNIAQYFYAISINIQNT